LQLALTIGGVGKKKVLGRILGVQRPLLDVSRGRNLQHCVREFWCRIGEMDEVVLWICAKLRS
jgi:hypothetical protein